MLAKAGPVAAIAVSSLYVWGLALHAAGIALYLSEVKGPVMDRLDKTDFLRYLSDQVFLTHYQAVAAQTPELFDVQHVPASPFPATQSSASTRNNNVLTGITLLLRH